MKRVHIFVKGRVQGVFFRAHTQKTAMGFRINGWVRNLADGRVEALFEGSQPEVDAMTDWCRQGPSHAVVEHLEVIDEPYIGELSGFHVLY